MSVANRPVDMSEEFRKNGWAYCKYLITDPRSDAYLRKAMGRRKKEPLSIKNRKVSIK